MSSNYDSIDDTCLMCANNVKYMALNYQSSLNKPVPEDSIIRMIWDQINIFLAESDDITKQSYFEKIKHNVDTSIEETNKEGSCLEDKETDHIEWLDEAKKDESIKWEHWKFYKDYLTSDNSIKSKQLAIKINNETNKILSKLENPNRPGAWDSRGLVVGDVQAGKTSNYIGLMAKAVDAGYKVLIVLAGITNDLRKQTQERIDDGLLGYRTDKKGNNGVVQKCKGKSIDNKTSCDPKGDYKSSKVFNNLRGKECILFVVKKNASVLRNILLDLYKQLENDQSFLIKDIPLLLIDDEADNASPDTNVPLVDPLTHEPIDKTDIDPTMINRYIRAILSCFEKSAYVGYTATPYANLFEYPNHGKDVVVYDKKLERKIQVGEDLFPRNFIYRMATPSNYVGIDQFFGVEEDGSDALPVSVKIDRVFPHDIEYIESGTKKKTSKAVLTDNPESLKYAINCFVIASVIKDLRNTGVKHNTMLVHVDRLIKKQTELKKWISDYVGELKDIFVLEIDQTRRHFLNTLKSIWENEFDSKLDEIIHKSNSEKPMNRVEWNEIEKHVPLFIKKLTYKTINGQSLDELDYREKKDGLNVIAIGGDKLARGLTLYGLTISYFLRSAGTYDALTQMGRWFGYRDGYLDVCRVFTLSETYNNFQEIAVAVHDMYDQFDDLCKQPQRTPLDYGLRILTNPRSKIMITSRNKSKAVIKHEVSFSGSPVPTAYLPLDSDINRENYNILESFIRKLGLPSTGSSLREEGKGNDYFWTNVPSDMVINYFLDTSFVLDKQNSWFSLSEISSFVKKMQNTYSEIEKWTIAIINGSDNSSEGIYLGNYAKVFPSIRSLEPMTKNQGYYELNKRRITTGTDEAYDLTIEQYDAALRLTNEDRYKKGKKPTKTPSPHYIRLYRDKKTALLLIYILRLKKEDGSLLKDIVPGFMISFPELGHREMDQSFWANVIYEKNGKTAAKVLLANEETDEI